MTLIFSDGSGAKRRPVIVVSAEAFHAARRDVLVVPLTTRTTMLRFGDYLLRDWERAGLPRRSMAKGTVETIARNALGRRIGQLTQRDLTNLEENLRSVLGL